MKKPVKVERKSRAVAKEASRSRDSARLAQGESGEALQKMNSIFPDEFFSGQMELSNLAQAVGK